MSERRKRLLAACYAAFAWVALALQFYLSLQLSRASGKQLATAIVIYFGFFTILTNILAAGVMTGMAAGRRVSRSLFSGVTVSMVIVGIVYSAVLRDLWNPQGWQKVADIFLHDVAPLAITFYWAFSVAGSMLRWRDAVLWLSYPLLYLVFCIMRGASTGVYPYPFIDVGALGWLAAARNAAALTLLFLLAGWAFVWVDHKIGQFRKRSG